MSETVKATIEWRYLPELPPEPRRNDIKHYLVTNDGAVREGWYEGNGEWWTSWTLLRRCSVSNVKAWAEWPEAPPVKAL